MNFLRITSCKQLWLAFSATLILAACGGGGGSSGNLSASASMSGSANTFTAALKGTQEIPPNSSAATGTGSVVVDPVSNQMTANITTTGMAGTAATIQAGAPGVTGPVIFTLTETSAGSGIWNAKAVLTPEQANALGAGNYYFNVASAIYPNGEIRGQIVGQQSTGAPPDTSGSATTGSGTSTGTGTTGTGMTGTGTTGTGTTTGTTTGAGSIY